MKEEEGEDNLFEDICQDIEKMIDDIDIISESETPIMVRIQNIPYGSILALFEESNDLRNSTVFLEKNIGQDYIEIPIKENISYILRVRHKDRKEFEFMFFSGNEDIEIYVGMPYDN